MSEPLNDFLEIIEQHVDEDGMSDLAFGMFVREAWKRMKEREGLESASIHTVPDYKGNPIRVTVPTSDPAKIEYEVCYEFSVGGYHTRNKTFTGIMDKIKGELSKAIDDFINELLESDKRCGDLREYTPQFANGYVGLDGFEPEQGTHYDLTLLTMERVDTKEALDYHDPLCDELRNQFGG